MQLEEASGVSPWLYVSSVEFAKNVGAGEQVMSGCLKKSVSGSGEFFDISLVQLLVLLGHCVLISM
jgi:hypothetical protein